MLLFRSLIESPGDLIKDDIAEDLELPLKVISEFRVLLSVSQIQGLQYRPIMFEVNYNGRTSYAGSYCRTEPVGPLYDAERDLLAIAKFRVTHRRRGSNESITD